ncbi:hypothetical protein DEO72_LG11g1274 [Vigna unguiculata]|uniref:Uncharacterized protein n=1 Tax=Vigna unguiculata TaxID=3917 RepID=A0A4D6NPW2_VIGUN|nr:hypothetical protein DEO72_LG11g1274 [Vigna unguiculata]
MPRVYPISRATTQGIPFRATTQGMLQQSSSLRFHSKPRRSSTSKSPSNYSTMDPGYMMLPRTCPFVVLSLRTSLLVVQLYGPPRRSLTHVIQQLRTSPFATALKCEHGTYKPPRWYPHTRAS